MSHFGRKFFAAPFFAAPFFGPVDSASSSGDLDAGLSGSSQVTAVLRAVGRLECQILGSGQIAPALDYPVESIDVFDLYFSGTRLGDYVESLVSLPRILNDVSERHNFWSSVAIQDRGYTAVVWDTEFKAYCEATDFVSYLENYVSYADLLPSSGNLELRYSGVTSVAVNFGACYMVTYLQDEPDKFIFHSSGMVRFKFIGSATPVAFVI